MNHPASRVRGIESAAAARRSTCRAVLTLLLGAVTTVPAQDDFMPAAPPGVVEAGTPAFVVLTPGALGLSAPPTDIDLLPDGRLLLIAPEEITIGDGVRWETHGRSSEAGDALLNQVVVDDAGTIYTAVAGGFARVAFGEDGRWQLDLVASLPAEALTGNRVLGRVSVAHGEWYWCAGSGAIVQWRPGQEPRVVGEANDFHRVLTAGAETLVSDGSTGSVMRLRGGEFVVTETAETWQVDRALLSSVNLPEPGRAILGTNGSGALTYDGTSFAPLVADGLLSARQRINDLCATAGGYYCAALDSFGLVFFDASGRVVQVLDRAVDHRLARVRQLINAPGGRICALLQEGVAQVRFPSRISYFEPLITTSLTYAIPTRHDGQLWLLADGQAQRGIYDPHGRLLRFEIDSPGPWVSTILPAGDRLLLATDEGIFQRRHDSWEAVLVGASNTHLGSVRGTPDAWIMVARDEVAWLQRDREGNITADRFPVPGMGSSYGTILQTEVAFWAELGTSRVARIVRREGRLAVRVLDRDDGFPDGWVQAFLVDGVVRFNVGGHVLRYDAERDRVVADPEFVAATANLVSEHGRPARDPSGRLWITTSESVRVIDDRSGVTESLERMPSAFTPIAFTIEADGTVWMHQRQRLVRFDPGFPEAEPPPLRALISQVHLVASGRTLTNPGPTLPDLDAHDNSLGVRFLAPHATFGEPVLFDVRLAGGAGNAWVPTGASGSASFAQLTEGRHELHVRPRSGDTVGEEARLAFRIRPPWFRSPAAYLFYGVAVSGLMVAIGLGWSYLARREQARLEQLVTERTAELRRSEEQYRRLSEELEERVEERTAELHQAHDRLLESNRELEAFSYSVSHDLRTPLRNIRGFADLLLRRSSAQLDAESTRYLSIVAAETARLRQLIDSLLAFSRLNRAELQPRDVDPAALVADARADCAADGEGRSITWQVDPLPPVRGDPTLLRQVFVNLISNAIKFTRGVDRAIITIGTTSDARRPGEIVFFIRDNGAGFDARYADKLFGVFQRLHGDKDFEGTGIGLAIVRRIVARHGGHTWADAEPGRGATFYFSLPCRPDGPTPTAPSTTPEDSD